MSTPLLNKTALRAHLLSRAKHLRNAPYNQFTRVSEETFERLEFQLRQNADSLIKAMPSLKSVTIKP